MKHQHRYERIIMGKDKNTFFRCNLPDCNHYVQSKLVKGKRTLCNRCNNEMIMDARAMKLEKPHCVDCIKVRRKPSHDKLLEYIEAQDITTRTQDIKT